MIVVFGSINLDLVARVARLPRPGETLTGETFAMLPGGKGAKQALAARRAGAEVAMAGAVGTDAFAAVALAALTEAGIDLKRVGRVDAPTGVALIHVDGEGENCITVVPGANTAADPATIPDTLLGSNTTIVMQLEVPLEAVADLARRARARHARVILNAAPARPLPAALFASVDVLVVNETEAAAVAVTADVPAMPETFAATIFRRFGCATVVTLGAQGALAVEGGRLLHVAAPGVRVVDTTGAGDAFTGARMLVRRCAGGASAHLSDSPAPAAQPCRHGPRSKSFLAACKKCRLNLEDGGCSTRKVLASRRKIAPVTCR